MTSEHRVAEIIERARWAPSGDNTQPWRFELLGKNHLRVHAQDTRDWCVYDLDGRASQISFGALIETIVLAASAAGLEAQVALDMNASPDKPVLDVQLVAAAAMAPDPLHAFIERRVTQRRPLSTTPLTDEDKRALQAAVGRGHRVYWIEGAKQRTRMAALLYRNAHIRLTIREAYEVHRRIIEWDTHFSEDRIPDRALGLNPLALRLMKWAMQSWDRVDFLNHYLGGTLLPRLEMDILPALRCAAHFFLIAERPPRTVEDYWSAGRAVQRMWLAATCRGLQFQPETTPVIFSDYVRRGITFTTDARALANAAKMRAECVRLLGETALNSAMFAGRLGYGATPTARSLRLPIARLRLQ